MGIIYNQYELLRSLSRLDYDKYKVLPFERLFFMCAAAVRSEPDSKKRQDDFGLALGCYYDNYRNQEYVVNAESHFGVA